MSDSSSQFDDHPAADEGPAITRHCRNCDEILQGEYCAHCGQRDSPVIRFFPTLVVEAFEGLFAFDSKTYRSLWLLFTRPAFLSREYLAGRRVRYLAPMRLFIIFLLAFLFTLSLDLFLDSVGVDLDQDAGGIDQSEFDDEMTTDLDEIESGIDELLTNLSLPFLSESNNQQLVALLQERAATNIEAIVDDPQDFFNGLLENLPVLLLLMLPMLAFLQKIFYLGSGKYYVEHLVLTVHNHSFLFLAFILIFLLDLLIWIELSLLSGLADILKSLLNFWIVIYLYLSLRIFSGQGFMVTGCKFIAISILYGALLLVCLLIFTLIGFFIY